MKYNIINGRLLILTLILVLESSSCWQEERFPQYAYRTDFAKYLSEVGVYDDMIASKKFIFILNPDGCSVCSGAVLDSMRSVPVDENIGVLLTNFTLDKHQNWLHSLQQFNPVTDTTKTIMHYELDIFGPALIVSDGTTAIHKFNISAETWEEVHYLLSAF